MTQESLISKPIQKTLVLLAVIGLVITGWIAGHIIRYSIALYLHPPIEEINPHIETGFEPAEIVLLEDSCVIVYVDEKMAVPEEQCMALTYYTSLPAKCRNANGELVRVGRDESKGLLISPMK